MARDDRAWAGDILAAISDVRADTRGIGVTGEAAKHLSADFQAARPAIPWRAIAAMRDRVVHEYFRTDTRRVSSPMSSIRRNGA